MDNTTYHGAAALLALLPILPLAMHLRRRTSGWLPRDVMVAGAGSLALLTVGAGIAFGIGAF